MSEFDSRFFERCHDAGELELLKGIRADLGILIVRFNELLSLLRQKPHLKSARVFLMPATINVGQTANAVILALDQNGQPFTLDSTYQVAYNASAPADVSFSPVNPDGSDTVAGVNADPGDAISATITRPDGVVINASADTLTVTAAAAVLTSASVSLTANASARKR